MAVMHKSTKESKGSNTSATMFIGDKQPPGMTNPMHRDTFYQINKKFPNEERTKVRANLQLLDWKANTGYMWDSAVLHLAANAGLEDRYSLQVSGFLNDTTHRTT